MAQALGAEAVVQRVPQGAEVRVKLLAHVAGQETQVLAGFDGRPAEHDARDGAGVEGLDGGANG